MPLLFLGIFATFASAWLGLVAYPTVKLGNLLPYTDEETGEIYPKPMSGLAIAGQHVYGTAGCVYCHSQQIRQAYITTSDIRRGWGSRSTVARDYMRDQPVYLGTMRTGPDLTNVGKRWPDPAWHHRHLYEPTEVSPGSIMPPYRYLYIKQKIQGQPSPNALQLTGKYAPEEGYEIVPSDDAKALVAYLISLNREYPLPEAPEPQLED
ncbi:MAG: cbb3-type cytochrome c oxidase subunit II [Chthoniobacterales bacterium]